MWRGYSTATSVCSEYLFCDLLLPFLSRWLFMGFKYFTHTGGCILQEEGQRQHILPTLQFLEEIIWPDNALLLMEGLENTMPGPQSTAPLVPKTLQLIFQVLINH